MSNVFETANYAEIEPDTLVAGDRWQWKRTDLGDDYPPASYALTYSALLEGTVGERISITASESGSDYLVEVASATTADFRPGLYHWSAYITRSSDSERARLTSGKWLVAPDLAITTDDPRSHAKKVLDALQAVIEGRATTDQQTFAIAGRSLSRMSADELLRFEGWFRARVQAEDQRIAMRRGRASARNVRIRF